MYKMYIWYLEMKKNDFFIPLCETYRTRQKARKAKKWLEANYSTGKKYRVRCLNAYVKT